MASDLRGLSIPSYGTVDNTVKSLDGISIPFAPQKIEGTPKSSNGLSISLTVYCFTVTDTIDPVEGVTIILEEDNTNPYSTNEDGKGFIFLSKGTATFQKTGFLTQQIPYDFTGVDDGTCITIELIPVDGDLHKITVKTFTNLLQTNANDFCLCKYECEYIEKVFADLSDSIEYKNDKSSFVFRKVSSSDIITINLYKSNVLVATISDDLLGEYKDDLPDGYVSFVMDWSLVASFFGFGHYQLITDKNILGIESEEKSRLFKLNQFRDEDAHNTVKITSFQNGNVVNGINYNNVFGSDGFYYYYRVSGRFIRDTPTSEIDDNQDTSYEIFQIRDKIINRFLLHTDLIPPSLFNDVIKTSLLGNSIMVTSYNLFDERFDNIPLRYQEISELNTYRLRTGFTVSIGFKDITENTIKRNF